MFINISLLHHHLSQEGIYTSCIKHSVRIQNDEISSLNHGVFFYTVTERIVSVWKSLPANVDFSSLLRYKQSVEQIDFSHFMQCDVL